MVILVFLNFLQKLHGKRIKAKKEIFSSYNNEYKEMKHFRVSPFSKDEQLKAGFVC